MQSDDGTKEPDLARPYTEVHGPGHKKLRDSSIEPTVQGSGTDVLEPRRAVPDASIVKPMCAEPFKGGADSMWIQSGANADEPSLQRP